MPEPPSPADPSETGGEADLRWMRQRLDDTATLLIATLTSILRLISQIDDFLRR